jgi:hypothetical protein
LRDKGEQFDEIEDVTAALERSLENLLKDVSNVDRALNTQRLELHRLVEEACQSCVPVDSSISKSVIKFAAEIVSGAPEITNTALDPMIAARLTPEVAWSIHDGASRLDYWSNCLSDRKDAVRDLMVFIKAQKIGAYRARSAIEMLREKRASLEAATQYRPMRR